MSNIISTVLKRNQITQNYLNSKIRPGVSILDLGSRTGENLHYVGDRQPDSELIAVDYHNRTEGGVKFVSHDLEHPLPFSDSSFDVVICNDVIEHVERKVQLALEIRRVGREAFVLSLPNTQHFKYVRGLMRGNMGKQYQFDCEDGADRHRWITYYASNFLFVNKYFTILERWDCFDRNIHRVASHFFGTALTVRNQVFICTV